jgi:hypothetical protein
MMKWILILIFLAGLHPGIQTLKSQGLPVREEIDSINALLKENPYRDTFLEITFYYSIDITSEKELVVKMDFDGPFKTVLKASIAELGKSFLRDTAYEGNSTICWYCNTDDTKKENNCVFNETITSDAEKESHYTDNICVMFARDSNIREELIKDFDKLFQLVLEQ